MLGGSTVKEDLLAPSFSELKEQLEAFQELLPKDFPFPDFKKGHVKTGMRHKGKKRTPFFGVLKETKASKVYGMTGLYKNGFSYPFLGAKKIREFLELDL